MKDDSGIFGSSWRGGVRDLRASLIPTSRVGGVQRDGDGDDRYGGGVHRGDEDDGNGDGGGVPLDGRDVESPAREGPLNIFMILISPAPSRGTGGGEVALLLSQSFIFIIMIMIIIIISPAQSRDTGCLHN